jgi:ABC-type transporter Mla subunit MlaD
VSLGPPFDQSGERWQLASGAAAVVGLVIAVAIALLASDRTLGDTFPLRILVRNPGALRTGARVMLAGQQIGEVVAIRGTGWLSPPPSPPPGAAAPAAPAWPAWPDRPTVEIEVRLLRSHQRYIYRNATFFGHTPNVLTESHLEIGPPAGGASPERPVEPGETVRGVDPPDIDRLLQKVHASLVSVLAVSRDLEPQWQEFRAAVDGLVRTARDTSGPAEFGRILAQADRALQAARHLRATFGQTDALPRSARLISELSRGLGELRPQLQLIAAQAERLDGQLAGLTTTFGEKERKQLSQGVALFRAVLKDAEKMDEDLRWLLRWFNEGRGTLGGFAHDIQIFDELKETGRQLKRETWKVLIKRKDPGQRHLR